MNVCELCRLANLESFSQEAQDDDYGDIPFLPAETGQTEGDRTDAPSQPGLGREPQDQGAAAAVDEGAPEVRGPPAGEELAAEAATPEPSTDTTDQGEQTVLPGVERYAARLVRRGHHSGASDTEEDHR